MSRSGNQEENSYDEYQYQDQRSQLSEPDISSASRPFQDLEPRLSQHPFGINSNASYFPLSDPHVPSLGEPYPGGGPTQWNYPGAVTGSSELVLSPLDAATVTQTAITSPVNFPPDDFGAQAADPSWSMPNTPNPNWDSFDDQLLDTLSMTGPPPADSTTAVSPVSSHGATAASIEISGTKTAARRPHRSSTGGDTSSSHSSHRGRRLRSAAQSSRAPTHRPGETDHDRAARASHNLVERNYRTRLNAEYEKLLLVVPVPPDDKKLSKHEVLELARERIRSLEAECAGMKKENNELKQRIEDLTTPYQDSNQVWTEGGGMGIPENKSMSPH